MIERIAIPVITSDKDFTLVAGDTVKILACQGVCFVRIREVVDVARRSENIAIFDVLAEIEPSNDDPGDKQSQS